MDQTNSRKSRKDDRPEAITKNIRPDESGRPGASNSIVRRRMQSTPQANNPLERQLRSVLHRHGIRFRTHYRLVRLPRRSIDIALVRSKIAIFVDGCFWHGCPRHGTTPKANRAWWVKKIEANRIRDAQTNTILRRLGWKVVRVWEHDDLHAAAQRVVRARMFRGHYAPRMSHDR